MAYSIEDTYQPPVTPMGGGQGFPSWQNAPTLEEQVISARPVAAQRPVRRDLHPAAGAAVAHVAETGRLPDNWHAAHHYLGQADPRPNPDNYHGPNRDKVFAREMQAWHQRRMFRNRETDHPYSPSQGFGPPNSPVEGAKAYVQSLANDIPHSLLPTSKGKLGNAEWKALIEQIDAKNTSVAEQLKAIGGPGGRGIPAAKKAAAAAYAHQVHNTDVTNKARVAAGLDPIAMPTPPHAGESTNPVNGKLPKPIKLPKGVLSTIRGMYGDPKLSKERASEIWHQYNARNKYPGLADFVDNQKGADPASFQTFYAQAIAPQLQAASDQYNTAVNSGYQAMQNILGSSALPSAERGVLQANAPLIRANDLAVGASMAQQAAMAPITQQLTDRLQSMIDEQQRARYAQNVGLGTSGGLSSTASSLASQLAG